MESIAHTGSPASVHGICAALHLQSTWQPDDGEQILGRSEDQVENCFWGRHPFVREFADKNKIRFLGALGGSVTMYAELLDKVHDEKAAEAAAVAELRPSAGPIQASRVPDPTPHDGEIHVLPVQGNVFMLTGDGGSVAVQVGDQGPTVINAGAGALTDKIVAEIRKLSDKPIQFIVNTGFQPDLTGGNVKLRAAGFDPSVRGSFFYGQFVDAGKGATIIGHQNVQNHLMALKTASDGWPSDTFV